MAEGNRNIRIRLLADTASFNAGLAKASKSANDTATQLEKGGKKSQLLTNGLALAGTAAAALGVAAIATAANFDQSMSEVQAATHASTGDMGKLRDAAIKAGADTIYSASDAADGIEQLGKAGLNTSDILSGGLSGALDLAASDGMAVGDAAELMASSLAQFNLRGSQATQVADALAAGAGNAQGSAKDLGMALSQSGLVANSMGITMQQTTGTLSAFANAGMIGSDAGTSLKTMLQRLASPTKTAQGVMDELGISAYDASGKFVGMSNLAGQLQKSMSGMSQEQRNAAMNTMFGADAVRAANVLYSEGQKGIEDWTAKVSDTGYASEQAAARTNNLKGDVEQLGGSFETFLITLGEGGQGPLRALTQGLTGFVNMLAAVPAPISQTVVMLTALAGGLAAAHKAFGNLTTSSSGLAQGLGKILDPWSNIQAVAANYSAAADSAAKKQVLMNAAASAGKAALIGLGIAAAAWVASLYSTAIQDYTQGIKDYSDAMKDAKSSAEKVSSAQDVLKSKFLDGENVTEVKSALDSLNMSWDDFANAMTTGGDAAADVSDKINTMLEQSDNAEQLGDKSLKLDGAKYKSLSTLSEMVRDNAREISAANEQDKARNQLLGEAAGANDGASSATETNSATLATQQKAADAANTAVSNYIKTLFNLPGMAVSSDQAITSLNQTILQTSQSITENGKVLSANGDVLANHKAAAYEAQSGLQGIASSAQTAAQKILEEGQATGDMDGATKQAQSTLASARNGFIAAATAAGMSKKAASALADEYGLIPGSVKTDVIAKDAATDVINKVKDMSIADKFFTIHGSYQDDSGGTYTSTGYRPKGAKGTIPYATGGPIGGIGTGTSDSNLIAASKGEYMIREKSARALGLQRLDYINRTGTLPPAFANGGTVSSLRGPMVQAAPQKIMVQATSSVQPNDSLAALAISELHNDLPRIIATYAPTFDERTRDRIIRAAMAKGGSR